MLTGPVQPTAYDLRLSVAGIPVRVSIWFWVAGAMLGYQALDSGADYLLTWMIILFISILVHELGHAIVARSFGYQPRILLYHFGGLAMYEPWGNYSRWKSILISAAGPAAGFAFYALILVVTYLCSNHLLGLPREMLRLVVFALRQLVWLNLYWNLVNLLPVLPLDGGRICQEICSFFNYRESLWYASWIGAVVAGLAAAYFFANEDRYAAVLFVFLCMGNVSELQQGRRW